jgi:cold shock CspA family protein/ribosome-associated translation inhibitor RaiA
MILPVQVSFRGMDPSPAIEQLVRKHARSLDKFDDRITACRVIVERPHRRHHKGDHIHVRIDVTIPSGEVVVNRDPPEHSASADPAVAVREAFHAARRQIQDVARRRRRTHPNEGKPIATVIDVAPEHGFLLTADGREIYFHKNAVLGDGAWDRLEIGDEVRFVEEAGIEGPQASTVTPLGVRA